MMLIRLGGARPWFLLAVGFDPCRLLDYSIEVCIGRRIVRDPGMIGCKLHLYAGMNLPRFLRCTYDMPMPWYRKGWRHPADWTGRDFEIIGFRWERSFSARWCA